MNIGEIMGNIASAINGERKNRENRKLKRNLAHHRADINELNFHMTVRLPEIAEKKDIEELNHLAGFVREKQAKLAGRHRIPAHIREDGNKNFQDALERIENIKKEAIG